jgi:uncharacterized protein (TIGR02271 family)
MSNRTESDDGRRILPVLAERLRVGRRRVVTGKVRIRKVTRTRDVVMDESGVREEVVVRRVPVGRFVDAAVPDRWVRGALVVSVLEEVPVVVRRLRVVEELHIQKRKHVVTRPRRITLRREEAIIEREPGGRLPLPKPEGRVARRLDRR